VLFHAHRGLRQRWRKDGVAERLAFPWFYFTEERERERMSASPAAVKPGQQIVKCPFRKCTTFLTRRAVTKHFQNTHGRLPTEKEKNDVLLGRKDLLEGWQKCPDCGLKFVSSQLYLHVIQRHRRIPCAGEFKLPENKERCLLGIVAILEEGEMPMYCRCLSPAIGQTGICRKCLRVLKLLPKTTPDESKAKKKIKND
jgi:uncharacterized C2H2 Zn-finger protein